MARAARIALIAASALASIGFLALAAWQIQRLGWKQDLIARVEQRLEAEPAAPPRVASKADEYRRVRLRGQFEPREALVQANTELGGGYWVLAPLRLADGSAVLINRGFVPPERRAPEQ
ncbi:MAG: SURF1 family protein, partial [Rubrivivax sp.]